MHPKEETPVALALMEPTAVVNTNTVVWIKGKYFSLRCQVFFGDSVATVLEHTPTLLTVQVPVMIIWLDTEVSVFVQNVGVDGSLYTSNPLKFTYLSSQEVISTDVIN